MKLNLVTALLASGGALALLAPYTVSGATAGAAIDLNSCCTAGDQDFPKIGGNLGNQNYSALKKVTRLNVSKLGGAWMTHVEPGQSKTSNQSTPVAVDGVIYLETGHANVVAVDGKTGAIKWRWTPPVSATRRGLAVAKDLGLVYTLSQSKLVALDMNTGAVMWQSAAYTGMGNVGKPALVYADKRLYIGSADAKVNAAFSVDATNGAVLNTFFGVPQNPGDIGYDTWGDAPASERAGAAPWVHPAVDPEMGMVYWTFGNSRGGSSQNSSSRPGQNLFANSVVALDWKTGEYKWHFQGVHQDIWDNDDMYPVLADVTIAGQPRKVIVYGGKTGRYFILDRRDGSAPLGIDEVPVPVDARQNSYPTQPRPRQGSWTETCPVIEPLGGPVPGHPARAVPNYPVACQFAPHWDGVPILSILQNGGGATWNQKSFSHSTKLVYTGYGYQASAHSLNEGSNGLRPPGEYMTGAVVAVDPSTNLVRWTKQMPYSMGTGQGVLTTAGDLLFVGQVDGYALGLDAATGRELWRFQTGAAISASPITYQIDGEQYVAFYAGGTSIPFGNSTPLGDNLWAFKIGGTLAQAETPPPPAVRRPVSGNPVAGTAVNNTVLLGRSSPTANEQSINSGSTNGMYPTHMQVPVGTTVTFTNPASSAFTHCATQFFEGLFNISLAPGQSGAYTFTKPGEYFFNDCHNPRSTGKIEVQ